MRPSAQRRAESIARALVTVLLRTSGTAHRVTPTVGVKRPRETGTDLGVCSLAAKPCGAEGGWVSGQLFVCASTEFAVEISSPFSACFWISKRYCDPQSRPSAVAAFWVVETTLGAAEATPTSKKANRKTSFFKRHLRGEDSRPGWGRKASTVGPAGQETVRGGEGFLYRTPVGSSNLFARHGDGSSWLVEQKTEPMTVEEEPDKLLAELARPARTGATPVRATPSAFGAGSSQGRSARLATRG
jgi:hypothetical protein